MVSKTCIEEYKAIHLKKTGIILSDEDATRKATDLVNLMEVLLKSPLRSNQRLDKAVQKAQT